MVIGPHRVLLLAALAMFLAPMLARAEAAEAAGDRDGRARTLFLEGVQNIREQRWKEAEAQLRRSQELVPRVSTLYNLALVTFKQGRLLESLELASEVLDTADPTAFAKYRQYAALLIERIEREVSFIDLSVRPAKAVVAVDGKVAAGFGSHRTLPLDPGRHRIEFSMDGYATETVEVVVGAGGRRDLSIDLEPAEEADVAPTPARVPAPPPAMAAEPGSVQAATDSGPGLAPWLVAGVGGALLGGALVTGVLAERADDDFARRCPGLRECDPGLQPERDRIERLGRLTDVLLVAGGAGVVGGLGWWLLSRAGPRSSGVRATARVVSHAVELRVLSDF